MDPLETARLYYKAYPDRDCETMMDLLSEESWSEGGSRSYDQALSRCHQMQGRMAVDSVFEPLRVTSENDRRAVVEVRVTPVAGGPPVMHSLGLVHRDGAWKVDDLPVF